MENQVIILTSESELREKRINEIIGEVEGTFFSNPNADHLSFNVSQTFGYSLKQEDVDCITKRLSLPNLFNINFGVLTCADRHDDYLSVGKVA